MAEGRNEPSMDEILSSIKRIIADDERIRPAARRAPKAAPVADEDEDESVLELTEIAADEEGAEEVLLDDHTAQSLRHSFSAWHTLSDPGCGPTIVRSRESSLECRHRDLCSPLLASCLDTNLPPIVEAMVEREITRITKKG